MPPKLHAKLKHQAKKKGYGKKRADKYVYGTMQNIKDQRNSGRKK